MYKKEKRLPLNVCKMSPVKYMYVKLHISFKMFSSQTNEQIFCNMKDAICTKFISSIYRLEAPGLSYRQHQKSFINVALD